jgi:ClpP class serine protease
MMEFVLQYGFFAAKTATVVVAVGVLAARAASLSRRGRQPDRLQVTHLNERYRSLKQVLEANILPRKSFKAGQKARRQERKALRKRSAEEAGRSRRVFVINFRGDIRASAVATGEHWYGRRALERALCDELRTSDDYLLAASREAELYELAYTTKKPLTRKLTAIVNNLADGVLRRRMTLAI